MPRFRAPSPAMGVALLALFVAMGGTTWAAVTLPRGSVGTPQLKRNAVTGPKVANHSLTGADIKARVAGHGAVGQAARRPRAVAGTVYTAHFENAVSLPDTPTSPLVVASLSVPAGNYVLSAKGQMDTFNSMQIVECDLIAGADVDKSFGQGGGNHQSQILTNSLVHSFAAAGKVDLACSASNTRGALPGAADRDQRRRASRPRRSQRRSRASSRSAFAPRKASDISGSAGKARSKPAASANVAPSEATISAAVRP